jgi:hypothetical protein
MTPEEIRHLETAHPETLAEARHAHHLRGLIADRVGSLRARYFALYHEARELRATLTAEHHPLGFGETELADLVRTLDLVTRAGE